MKSRLDHRQYIMSRLSTLIYHHPRSTQYHEHSQPSYSIIAFDADSTQDKCSNQTSHSQYEGPLPPSLCLRLTFDEVLQFLFLAAIIGTTLANAQFLTPRADTTTIAQFGVYNVSECASTGLGLVADHQYQIASTKCTNTPPNPDLALLPFLSYRTSVVPPPGETCFLDVFAGEGCTDNYQGFQITASNNFTCQEVVVETTGNEPTLGAKSVRLTC